MKMMKKIALLCVTGVMLTQGAVAWAGDAKNGKRVFGEKPDTCLKCHGDPELFIREERKAKNLEQLEDWVRRCDIKTDTKWYEKEVNDVIAYLNQEYYHY